VPDNADKLLFTVILDMGGVLMTHNRAGCQQALQQFMSADDIYHILGFGNDKPDSLRMRFEKGLIDQDEFVDSILALSRPGTTEQQVIDAWNKMHAGIPDEAWETIKKWRTKGYRTYLMSNTDAIHWQHTLSLYRQQVESLFDGVFLSFELGMIKPSKAFFLHVANAIDEGQTIFVDDMEANRLAARQFVGWQTCASIEEWLIETKN